MRIYPYEKTFYIVAAHVMVCYIIQKEKKKLAFSLLFVWIVIVLLKKINSLYYEKKRFYVTDRARWTRWSSSRKGKKARAGKARIERVCQKGRWKTILKARRSLR